jgi:cytoskeletal protein CcmA (bactofilin family)
MVLFQPRDLVDICIKAIPLKPSDVGYKSLIGLKFPVELHKRLQRRIWSIFGDYSTGLQCAIFGTSRDFRQVKGKLKCSGYIEYQNFLAHGKSIIKEFQSNGVVKIMHNNNVHGNLHGNCTQIVDGQLKKVRIHDHGTLIKRYKYFDGKQYKCTKWKDGTRKWKIWTINGNVKTTRKFIE